MLVNHALTIREEIDALDEARRPVLGLDPGLRTGVALLRSGALLFCADYDMRHDWRANEGRALRLWHAFILGQLREHRPRCLAIEKANGARFGSTLTIPNSVRLVAQMAADEAGVPVRLLSVQTVRKAVCGSGKAKKPDVAAALDRLGLMAPNDHARDAAAVALAAERMR
jgi:Holliday junction resolvasome RuvABC endonuclease subunit